MIQNLITYILIAASVAYMLSGLFRMIYPVNRGRQSGCAGCPGCELKKPVPVETAFKPVTTEI
jgi:hypothetical protein